MGRASLGITSLWPPRRLSGHVWLGKSPGLEKEKYVIWTGPSLLPQLFCYSSLGVLVHRKWLSNYFTLGSPSTTCLITVLSPSPVESFLTSNSVRIGHPQLVSTENRKNCLVKKKKKKHVWFQK